MQRFMIALCLSLALPAAVSAQGVVSAGICEARPTRACVLDLARAQAAAQGASALDRVLVGTALASAGRLDEARPLLAGASLVGFGKDALRLFAAAGRARDVDAILATVGEHPEQGLLHAALAGYVQGGHEALAQAFIQARRLRPDQDSVTQARIIGLGHAGKVAEALALIDGIRDANARSGAKSVLLIETIAARNKDGALALIASYGDDAYGRLHLLAVADFSGDLSLLDRGLAALDEAAPFGPVFEEFDVMAVRLLTHAGRRREAVERAEKIASPRHRFHAMREASANAGDAGAFFTSFERMVEREKATHAREDGLREMTRALTASRLENVAEQVIGQGGPDAFTRSRRLAAAALGFADRGEHGAALRVTARLPELFERARTYLEIARMLPP